MVCKEIRTQQQSRRDRNRQQRGIETPEEKRRRLERQNRESGTQEDGFNQYADQLCELEDEQVRQSTVSQMKKVCGTVHSDEIPDAHCMCFSEMF